MEDNDDDTTYKIVRMYFSTKVSNEIIKRGLTLEEAQAHCGDPETSSQTCTESVNIEHAQKYGPWFDAYQIE